MKKQQKKHYTKKEETQGRIIAIVLMMIPIALLLLNSLKFEYYIPFYFFFGSTFVAIFLNQLMSFVMRKKYKEIHKDSSMRLFNDNKYGPAMFSRAFTFFITLTGAFVISWLSSITGFWNGFIFFFIGYIYFTAIQFRKL